MSLFDLNLMSESNKKVVAASGYFDPIHSGHIEYLKLAKGLGDKLVVILNNDHQAKLKKGREFMPLRDRKAVLEAVKYVDEVFVSVDMDQSVIESLKAIKPDIFSKGGDRHQGEIPETPICRELGIKIIDGLGAKIQSSSELIMKSKPRHVGAGFGVLVLRDEKVLLGKRHEDPEKADSLMHGEGKWTMPGGKLEFGESLEEAAKREVLEEAGIKVRKLDVISISNDIVGKNRAGEYVNKGLPPSDVEAHFVTVGFICKDFEGEPKVMEPDEITEWKWFPLDHLPSPIYPPSQKVLKNYLEEKFF